MERKHGENLDWNEKLEELKIVYEMEYRYGSRTERYSE